jgi:predicted outer membrane repeat protein
MVVQSGGKVSDMDGNNSGLRLRRLEPRALPATFVVSNLADSGPGSIRQAILDANANPGADVVQIPAGLTGTVTLTSGAITISDPLTISGTGTMLKSPFVMTTNNNGRVFVVNAPTTLSGIGCSSSSVTGGLGGAVLSTAALTLIDCRLSGNSASGGGSVHQTGPSLTVTRCEFFSGGAKTGGAIYSTGDVSLQYCSFFQNRGSVLGAAGGGVYLASGSLSIESCSFFGCGSTNTNFGQGGAVYCAGTFFAQNTSFSDNVAAAGAGLYLTAGGTLWNCTVATNLAGGTGGGIYGSVTLESTLVSNNTAMTGPDIFGAVTAKHCALGSSSGFSSFTNQGGNLPFGQDFQVQKGSFGHGGLVPVTTILATSPCKNMGSNPGGLAYDARGPGFPRAVGTAPDIGAFEVQPPPRIASIQVNDGSAQRSGVVQLTITVDTSDWLLGPSTPWELTRVSDNAKVTWGYGGQYAGGPNSIGFRFLGGPVNGASLADGVYVLRIYGSSFYDGAGQNLDGNGDGIGGDDYVSPLTGPGRIHRLFGDADGDGDVDAADFAALRGAFGGASVAFDFDGDGDVDAADFGQFRARFGTSI